MSSNIYTQLNTKTLSSVSATDISEVTNPIHIQERTISDLKNTILVNTASFRQDGGPIPGTQKIITQAFTDSGATNQVIFTPAQGEVWSISAGSYSSTGGTSRLFLFLKDNVSSGTPAMEIADESASSGQHNPLDPFKAPGFLIDENMSIVATVAVTDSVSSNLYLSASRVR